MKYKMIYLASLPLLFSIQAAASELPFQSYWYTGIGLGSGYYSNGGNPQSYENQHNGFAGTVYLGYQPNPYLASELSYQFLGNAHANYTQGQISGHFQQVVLAARAGYPLTSWLYPYAKIGGASWFGESKGLRIGDEQGFSPIAAAGIEYAITSRLVAQLEYQYTDKLGADSIGYTDHHLTTIGLNWRFGQSAPAHPPTPEPEIIVQPVEVQPKAQTIAETQFIYSELKGQSLFAVNSSVLNGGSQFDNIVNFLKQHPSASAVITGHTDNTGTDQYNQWLSERRAASVVDYLVSQGVSESQLTAIGQGSTIPVIDNATAHGRAMNRRIEITVPEFTETLTME